MIGIRADANEKIASGHLMRCMAVGEKIRQMGSEPLFLIADEFPAPMLESRNFHYCVLHSDWRDKMGEIPVLKEMLKNRGINVLLVDSYEVEEAYFTALKETVRLAYLDDLCLCPWPVDALVNYAVADAGRKYEAFSWKKKPEIYAGLSYTPLREEFEHCGESLQEQVKEALLTTGGSDPLEMTRRFLESVWEEGEKEIRWHVAAGPFFPEPLKDVLRRMQEKHARQMVVHENEKNMAALAKGCGLAVCAGGTTLLELCACRIPCACFIMSENQKALVRFLSEKQAVAYGGDVCGQSPEEVARQLKKRAFVLADSHEERKAMIRRCGGLVDGKGAGRIARMLTGLDST